MQIELKENIDCSIWRATDPKCVFLLVHGLGTYSERWEPMANFFLKCGVSSYAANLPRLKSVSDYYCAILRIRDLAEKDNPGKKIFLIGESLGALASFLFTAEHPELFAGLICVSPAFASRKAVGVLEAIKMVMTVFYNPSRQVDLPFDSSMCTRDSAVRDKLDKDPFEYRSVSVKLVFDILASQARAKVVSKKIKTSALFLVAGEDMIVDPGASKKIFESLETGDKTYLCFPEMYHSLSIELGKETVFEKLRVWVEERL
jgi:alpha-beta hydrolase superfamily lysophospholipase